MLTPLCGMLSPLALNRYRVSAGTGFNPATLPNAVLVLDPSVGAFTDAAGTSAAVAGDFVRLLRDQSSAQNNALSRTDSERPQIVIVAADTQNNVWLDMPGFQGMITECSLTMPFTIYLVERAYGAVGEARSIQSRDINALINTRRSHGNNVYLNGLVHQSPSAAALDISCLQVTTSGCKYVLNGADKTDYPTQHDNWQRMALGSVGAIPEDAKTRIGFLACIAGAVSQANHDQMMRYLATRFNACLLDTAYSGTTLKCACSLRNVRSAYTGPILTVRRTSDNATQDIYANAMSLIDTASLLNFAGSGSVYVTTWYDQSGSGNHLTQTVSAKQPQIVNNGTLCTGHDGSGNAINLPAVRFGYAAGSPQYLDSVQSFSGVAASFVTVAEMTQTIGASRVWSLFPTGAPDFASGTSLIPLLAYGGSDFSAFHGGQLAPVPYITNKAFTASSRFSASQTVVRAGTGTNTGNPITGLSSTTLRIGNSNVGSYESTDQWYGTFQELVAFSGTLTDTDEAAIATNQRAFWNVQ